MTKEQAKQLLPLIQAYSEGKIIQINKGNKWTDLDFPSFDGEPSSYRIKPEPPNPTYRPWKPEEVPIGVAVRGKTETEKQGIIFGRIDSEIGLKGLKGEHTYSPNRILNYYEYSTDFGKTWQPCGVLIGG